MGVDRDLGFSQGPQTKFFPTFCILPTPLIPQKFPRNYPKSTRNPQNLKKSNFSSFGLDRDQPFSRGFQSHSSPHSEYYPRLYPPQKSPSHHIYWFCINFPWNVNLTLIVLLVINGYIVSNILKNKRYISYLLRNSQIFHFKMYFYVWNINWIADYGKKCFS